MKNIEIQIGDYVAIALPKMIKDKYVVDRNPGIFIAQLVEKKYNILRVKYPETLDHYDKYWWTQKSEIIDFSRSEEDLYYILDAQKYNM